MMRLPVLKPISTGITTNASKNFRYIKTKNLLITGAISLKAQPANFLEKVKMLDNF